MKPLTLYELENMRGVLINIETSTAEISRPTPTTDGAGGETVVYATVATENCMYYRSIGGAPETQRPDVITTSEDFIMTFAVTADIQHSDRILVDGLVLEVKSISNSTDGLEVAKQITASEVT